MGFCRDIGGRDKRHPLWRHYYRDAKAIIFVVVRPHALVVIHFHFNNVMCFLE